MENTLYFKDMIHCDQNNYPKKIYKVEYSKMLIEILDSDHIQGRPFYFSSLILETISSNKLKIIF